MQSVIPKLIDNGHFVIGIDNLSRHNTRGVFRSARYDFIQADASDYVYMDEIFENRKIDYTFQGAATIFGVGGFNKYCADILTDDLKIQINMLDLSQKWNIKKFVYISSSMVYEMCESKPTGNMETEPWFVKAPITDYGLSKFVGERMVQSYDEQYGLDYTIWRPFNIITPGEIKSLEQGYNHVFSDFIDSIIGDKVEELPILGQGNQVRCFTWIDDVAKMIADNSFGSHTVGDGTYNIGNPEPVSMIELANRIKKIGYELGLCSDLPLTFKTTDVYPNDVQYRIPDIGRIQQKFNFKPSKTLDESLRECIIHYSRVKLKW